MNFFKQVRWRIEDRKIAVCKEFRRGRGVEGRGCRREDAGRGGHCRGKFCNLEKVTKTSSVKDICVSKVREFLQVSPSQDFTINKKYSFCEL